MRGQAVERRLPGLVAHPQRGVLRGRAGAAGGAAQLPRRARGARAAGGAGGAHRRAEGGRRQAGRRQAARPAVQRGRILDISMLKSA